MISGEPTGRTDIWESEDQMRVFWVERPELSLERNLQLGINCKTVCINLEESPGVSGGKGTRTNALVL